MLSRMTLAEMFEEWYALGIDPWPLPLISMDDPQRYLDPLALAKVRGLELQARLVVEGYLSGMHKSPYHGFSVEFAQHREYVPGDDIKHVDWKVYGRTGRF